MLNLSCEVPVYAIKWMDDDEFILSGGGEGKEIPNYIMIFDKEFNLLLRYETGDNTLLRLDYKDDVIIGSDMRNIVVFQLERFEDREDNVQYEITRVIEREVKANEYPDAEPKLCRFNNRGNGFAVSDDDYHIEYFTFKDKKKTKLNEKESVVLQGHHESVISSISFSETDELLISGDKDNICCVWDLKTNRNLVEYTPDFFREEEVKFRAKIKKLKKRKVRRLPLQPKYRVCFTNYINNRLHMIHTTRSGPTWYTISRNFINKEEELGGEEEQNKGKEEEVEEADKEFGDAKEIVYEACKEGCTSVSPLRDGSLLAFGCSGEILQIYDLEEKRLKGSDRIEGCVSITCCDVAKSVKEREGREVIKYNGVCGSFMSKIYTTKFKKKRSLLVEIFKNLMWIILVVVIVFMVGGYFENKEYRD